MHEWKAHWMIEWRLLLRNRVLYIIVFLGFIVAFLLHLVMSDLQHIEGYVKGFLHMYVWVFSLIAILYGVYVALRDKLVGVDEISNSWSYSTGGLWFIRFFVAFIPFFILALVPLFLYIILSLYYGSSIYLSVVWTLASGVVTMIYSIILGIIIGGLIFHLASYLVAFLLWLVQSIIIYYYIARILPPSVGYVGFVIPFDFEALGYFNGLSGFYTDISYLGQRGFYLFLSLALLMLFISYKVWKRKEKSIIRYSFIALVSVLIASSSLHYYVDARMKQEYAYDNFLNQVKLAGELANLDVSGNTQTFAVQSYDMSLYLSEDNELNVDAVLTLDRRNEQNWADLVFTLMPFFTVNSVKINGEPIQFNHSWVHIHIPNRESWTGHDKLTITLSYKGQVKDIRDTYFSIYNTDRNLIPFQMAQHDYLYLTHAWFPILGEWPLYDYRNPLETRDISILYEEQKFLLDLYPEIPPADFRVTVDYPDGINILSNLEIAEETNKSGRIQYLFEGKNVTGVVLIGGRLEEIRISNTNYQNSQMNLIYNQTLNTEHAYTVIEMMNQTWCDLMKLLEINSVHSNYTFIPTGRITSPGRYQFTDYNKQIGSSIIHRLYPESGIALINEGLIHRKSEFQSLQYNLILHLIEEEKIFDSRVEGEQLRFFAASVSAYLSHKYWDFPYEKSVVYVPNEFKDEIATYMLNNTEERVIQTLREQYGLLKEQPHVSVEEIISHIYQQREG